MNTHTVPPMILKLKVIDIESVLFLFLDSDRFYSKQLKELGIIILQEQGI